MSRLAGLFLNQPPATGPEPESSPVARYTLLFVDDEPNVLKALRRIFRRENYEILLAANAEEGLQIFAEGRPVHLVISDHRMPGMSGATFLRRVKEKSPETIRIMLTGHADVQAVMGAINEGAVYKFITKPWNDEDLRVTVALALEQYELVRENRKLRKEAQDKDSEIRSLRRFSEGSRSQLGRFLLKRGTIDKEQLAKLSRTQAHTKENLVALLLRSRICDEKEILQVIQQELKLERVALPEWRIPPELLALLPRTLCESSGVLPLRLDGKRITVAMVDPSDFFRTDDLAFVLGLEVVPVLVSHSELQAKIKEVFQDPSAQEGMGLADLMAEYDPLDTIEVVIEEHEEEDVETLLRSKDQPPAIRVVNAILSEAVRLGASDVHIEPRTKFVAVRYRIDGLLTDKIQVPPSMHLAVVSRLKILADLDIAERRRPQDGRITVKTARKIVDLRISTMPTMQGEKIVLRLLDRGAAVRRLGDLGVSEESADVLRDLARVPQGMVLTTGPTGSGKTTTLYALLAEAFDPLKNYVTIEDPVEYYLEHAGQVHIREKIGLNFATVLRAVLRQDPDVILLGEIRDLETAEVAMHAALTGHLVLSTLHTNSAAATLVRLKDLGLDTAVIASAVRAIVSQRLVRRACPACTDWEAPEPQLLADLDLTATWSGSAPRPRGCKRCQESGYSGRLALFEILEMNDPLRESLRAGAGEREIRAAARNWGMRTLWDDAREKAAAGLTTLQELLRVLGPQRRLRRPCEGCDAAVELWHNHCPRCGCRQGHACVSCGESLETGWEHCPACGTAISSRDSPLAASDAVHL